MRFESPDVFFHRPFLVQPLDDRHPHKVIQKSRQAGGSEICMREALWFITNHPFTNWVYVFPRKPQLEDFSRARLEPAIEVSPYLRSIAREPQNVTLKRFGSSHLYFRSGWEEQIGEGINADALTFDEKDRMRDKVEVAFLESMSSSRHRLLRELSTPSLPNRGVNASFQRSDQHRWFVKCKECGHEQTLGYPDNIIPVGREVPEYEDLVPPGSYRYCCCKCKGEINRREGRWIALYPDKADDDGNGVRGYHITQLMCPWIDADSIMQKKKDYRLDQIWRNYVLGEAYHGAGLMLKPEDFITDPSRREMNLREPGLDYVVAGVDWGGINWVVILGKKQERTYVLKIAWYPDTAGPLDSAKAVADLLAPFRPDMIVADAGYGKDRNAFLNRAFPRKKVFSCFYPSTSGYRNRIAQPSWSDAHQKVVAERTTSLKITCQDIMQGRFIFYEDTGGTEGFNLMQKHVCNLTTISEIDQEGELSETVANTGPDHLAHALNYARLGMEKISTVGSFGYTFVDWGNDPIPGASGYL